jgi:alkylation response protein AidB-like acyl-CoA dehydrogenase
MRFGNLVTIGAALVLGATAAQAQDKLAEYRSLDKEIDGLMVYNQLLEQQLTDQKAEIEALQAAIEQVPELERQIPPLLTRMVDGLEQFVAMDLPFLQDERTNRVAQLKTIIERADVTVAEKTRRVLEAWQVENEYGRTNLAYTGELEIDGVAREVDFLRVGRIALLYQTPDAQYTGAWDQRARQWVALGDEHRNSVRQGLRMARAQVAPDLLLIPVPPPNEG